MMDSMITKIVVAAIFIGYTGYTTFKSINVFLTFRKKFANFKEVHKEYELYLDSKYMSIICSVLAIVGFGMAAYSATHQTDQQFYFVMTYFCIGIIFVGLAFETYVRKRCFFVEEGIFYVDKIQRFRVMVKFEQRKRSLFRNVRVLMADGEKFEVSHKLGLLLEEKTKNRRKAKKNKK